MSNFRIAGVQMDVMLADKQSNLDAMQHWLRQTTAEGARLTVFPECALAGYCFNSLEEAIPYAESVPGPATQTVTEWCRKLNAFVVFGLLEQDGERLFNACTLVGPEGVVGNYRKIHLPYLGVDRFTTPGDQPFAVHPSGPGPSGYEHLLRRRLPRVVTSDGSGPCGPDRPTHQLAAGCRVHGGLRDQHTGHGKPRLLSGGKPSRRRTRIFLHWKESSVYTKRRQPGLRGSY